MNDSENKSQHSVIARRLSSSTSGPFQANGHARRLMSIHRSFAFLTLVIAVTASLSGARAESPAATRVNLVSPLDYQVVQRCTRTGGKMIVAGNVQFGGRDAPRPDALEVQVIGKSSTGDLPDQWRPLPFDPRDRKSTRLN